MESKHSVSPMVILMAIRLVQPGRLADIAEGVARILPYEIDVFGLKKTLQPRLEEFRRADLICLYAGQRYMLMPKGKALVEESGIKLQIDERRMFLLKETRRANPRLRSGARDGSLKQ